MNRFQIQTVANLARLGFNSEECHQLIKAARTLSRWDENECNVEVCASCKSHDLAYVVNA